MGGATNMYTSNTEFGDLRFYRFLTTYLAMDHEYILAKIVPYIKKVNFYLNESRHAGGRLYCGANVPEEDLKLLVKDSRVRIPRMLSASESKETAKAFMTNAFFTIQVEKEFWGARSVAEFSEFPEEKETIFPPYSQFVVLDWDPSTKHGVLQAIDKYAYFEDE